ncbi:acyltransferase family protein [Halomonas sp. SL1]|uniref:acyltransferase family protein n=1 Tax=Halomonas sp. SL1 TaxID=2137478 RepID=UPI0015EC7DE6|nr:acyltransferase family protein [Halomonas sp. SL1]
MVSQKPQRNDIQGLRALAVLSVIVFHVDSGWLPGGFIGVDVFLVISGYLITSIVLHKREQRRFSFVSFYVARVRRIVPAYVLVLAVTSVVMAVLLIPSDFQRFKESLSSALYFSSNNYFSGSEGYFSPESYELPLLHTWSLAVEMQFYLLLPVILVVVRREFLPWVLFFVSVLLLGYSAFQLAAGQNEAVYFSLSARIPEFLVGSLLALSGLGETWSRGRSNMTAFLGLAMVLGSFGLITEEMPFPGLLALPACIGVAMIIAARNSNCNEFLSRDSLVWVGALSYSLYLWHWPILAAFRYFFESYQLSGELIALVLLLTLTLSYLSYRFVEVPFRTSYFRLGNLLRYATLVLFVLISLGISGSLNSKIIDPLSKEYTRYAPKDDICHGKVLESCVRGASNADKTILLMGDSHAAQLNYFANFVGREIGVRFEVVTASSCVPIEGFDVARISDFAHEPCREQIAEIKKRISHVDGVILAGMWVYHTPSEIFMSALRDFFEEMKSSDMPLLVLSQVPMLEGDVQRVRRFNGLGLSRDVGVVNELDSANGIIERLVSQYDNADFLDFSSLDLFKDAPLSGGELIYFDSHHLNEVGSMKYGRMASSYMDEWVKSAL